MTARDNPTTMSAHLRVACPACGAPMILRRNRENGSEFMGCSDFPKCKETQPLPAYVHVVRAGGQPLPGFTD